MDGLLLVDKPSGPTSHDVVARARRILREKRIGHTGTLDPLASGVLPLLVGKATRLARYLPGDKAYDATILLGLNTDTYDSQGVPTSTPFDGAWPDADAIDAALAAFRGTFLQTPPAFSAKKIDGQRSYAMARRRSLATEAQRTRSTEGDVNEPASPADGVPQTLPSPVPVTAYEVALLGVDGPPESGHDANAGVVVRLHVRCSAGFYIRSLAFDLGAALGTGAHLTVLRRTSAAGHGLAETIGLDRLMAADGAEAGAAALVPMGRMLAALPSVELTPEGVNQVRFGRNIRPEDSTRGFVEAVQAASAPAPSPVRLIAPTGELVAMADAASTPGLLHPDVVLL